MRRIGRISQKSDFQRLAENGKRSRSANFVVVFVEDETMSMPAVAFSIPKKLGKAVVRNRIRRRLRAVVSELVDQVPLGLYLIQARNGSAEVGVQQLRTTLAGLICLPRSGVGVDENKS